MVPVAGEDAVRDRAAMEREAHVRAAVVDGVDRVAVREEAETCARRRRRRACPAARSSASDAARTSVAHLGHGHVSSFVCLAQPRTSSNGLSQVPAAELAIGEVVGAQRSARVRAALLRGRRAHRLEPDGRQPAPLPARSSSGGSPSSRPGRRAGIPLAEIQAGARDPPARPNAGRSADWERLSRAWREDLDRRIATLEALHSRLTTCIGCGCLSIDACGLFNPDDEAAQLGAGAHYLRAPKTQEGLAK